MEARKKTRDLSVAEYFIQIQREYLIADFKRKIYFNPKDKAYYSRVMKYKAKRIKEIAERNNLFSILSHDDTLKNLRKELFDENGFPKFPMSETELEQYYTEGNSFSFAGEIYILKELDNNIATLLSALGDKIRVEKNKIFRIL